MDADLEKAARVARRIQVEVGNLGQVHSLEVLENPVAEGMTQVVAQNSLVAVDAGPDAASVLVVHDQVVVETLVEVPQEIHGWEAAAQGQEAVAQPQEEEENQVVLWALAHDLDTAVRTLEVVAQDLEHDAHDLEVVENSASHQMELCGQVVVVVGNHSWDVDLLVVESFQEGHYHAGVGPPRMALELVVVDAILAFP